MTLSIPDETIEAALKLLNSDKHAKAKAASEFSEKQLKTILARLAASSDATSAAAREVEAYNHPDYMKALESHRMVCEAYYDARDKRDAATAFIDVWRSIRADGRRADRIG